MGVQARRERAGWTDHRLDQEHVLAADGILGGEVTAASMPRGLDHVVHAVRDLDATPELYRRLGFTVGARNRHAWGTHNHLVQMPGFFIELLTVAEPEKLGSDGFSALFGTFHRGHDHRRTGHRPRCNADFQLASCDDVTAATHALCWRGTFLSRQEDRLSSLPASEVLTMRDRLTPQYDRRMVARHEC